jgi:hypothetical protein
MHEEEYEDEYETWQRYPASSSSSSSYLFPVVNVN